MTYNLLCLDGGSDAELDNFASNTLEVQEVGSATIGDDNYDNFNLCVIDYVQVLETIHIILSKTLAG